MQTGIGQIAHRRMLRIGSRWVVALLADLPADGVPNLMQVLQLGLEHGFGVALDLYFTLADLKRGMLGPGFADEVAEL